MFQSVRSFLKALEGIIKLLGLIQSLTVVEEDLWRLLGTEVRNMLSRILLVHVLGSGTGLAFFQELQGLRKIKDGHVVFLQSKMDNSEVVKVKLGVQQLAFLIDHV